MILNQKSNATNYNRYPEIFMEVQSIINTPETILSFGCSTGIECNTLHQLYFPNSKIIGLDICEEIISKNKETNIYRNIEYFSNVKQITKKCNLIFAMSVLCRWPETEGEYTFKTFTDTLNIIDELLENNGYLCIYNSKYIFTESELFKQKYEIVSTKHNETGFVHKYNIHNTKIADYPYFLFKKIK